MKYSEVEKKLKKEGCSFYKDGSNHPIWFSPITGKKFSLSYHRSEEVKSGTLKSISKDSGVKL
ncbi:MAG TPA: type II toxin-antitoxin system HicA family toxin [Prolixibacteraceae bacterium]|jgi:predicted RNA binding protein YcfA (HicA-like mRNA interferase family)